MFFFLFELKENKLNQKEKCEHKERGKYYWYMIQKENEFFDHLFPFINSHEIKTVQNEVM